MSLRDGGGFGELKVPLTWAAGIALIVAIVAAIALLLTDRRETFQGEAYGASRRVGDAIAAPVSGVLATPLTWARDGVDAVGGYFFAISENRRLKDELREMRQWRDTAIALRDTNQRYRTLLGLRTEPPVPMVAARIISDSRGPFANSRLANAGKERGVAAGFPVMSENGLVGRVIGVTTGVSRVLLLTDIASRTPVMIDRTNARAILTGDGGPNPKLEYLRGEHPVREGDRVLTSGDGGVLPRGLPVGTAVKGLDGRWRVVLSSDAAPIDYVQILMFKDFAQLANRTELDTMVPPPPAPSLQPLGVTAPEAGATAPANGASSAAAPATATHPNPTTPKPVAGAMASPTPTPSTPVAPKPPPPKPPPPKPNLAAPGPSPAPAATSGAPQ